MTQRKEKEGFHGHSPQGVDLFKMMNVWQCTEYQACGIFWNSVCPLLLFLSDLCQISRGERTIHPAPLSFS